MKKITLLLIMISSYAWAQKSILYNNKRELIADTTLRIDEHTYNNLPKLESELLPELYNRIKVPSLNRFTGDSAVVIVKFIIVRGECNFDIVRSKNAVLEIAVYNACKAMQKEYSRLHRREEYLMYVPVKFERQPDNFEELLMRNKAITIKARTLIEAGFIDTTRIEDWIYTPKEKSKLNKKKL